MAFSGLVKCLFLWEILQISTERRTGYSVNEFRFFSHKKKIIIAINITSKHKCDKSKCISIFTITNANNLDSHLVEYFLTVWKVSSIKPVFKNVTERSCVSQYYPINLLTDINKFFSLLSRQRSPERQTLFRSSAYVFYCHYR